MSNELDMQLSKWKLISPKALTKRVQKPFFLDLDTKKFFFQITTHFSHLRLALQTTSRVRDLKIIKQTMSLKWPYFRECVISSGTTSAAIISQMATWHKTSEENANENADASVKIGWTFLRES